jgi:hypothetical protein
MSLLWYDTLTEVRGYAVPRCGVLGEVRLSFCSGPFNGTGS